MIRRISTLVLVAVLVPWAVVASGLELRLTPTTTTGKVNDRTMEQFGGYTFKGKTKPSKKGQVVVFHFKRPKANKWRRFKVGPADGTNAFFVLDHSKPRDRIDSKHRWRIFLTPGVKPGKWVLRAKFLNQDGYEASSVWQRVRVSGSD